MASIQLENEVVQIPELRADGRNWPVYRERLERALTGLGVANYLIGTTPDPYDAQTNSFVKCSIASTIPNSLFSRILHIESARECFATLRSLFEPTTTTTSTVIDKWSIEVTREAAHTTHDTRMHREAREKSREHEKVKNGSGTRKRDVPSNETRRTCERKRKGQERVERNREVGDEGEKSCGRVGEEVAAAGGSGEEAANQRADGVSLATPVSSPERNHSKLEPPRVESNPNNESRTTHAIRTPSETESRGEGQNVAASNTRAAGACDEVERGAERVDEVDEDVATTNDTHDGQQVEEHDRADTSTDETAAVTTTNATVDVTARSANENETEDSPEEPHSTTLEGEKVESSGSSIELTMKDDASRASNDADDDVIESTTTTVRDDDEQSRSYTPNESPPRAKPQSRVYEVGESRGDGVESEDVVDVTNDDDDDAETVSEAAVETNSPGPPPEPPYSTNEPNASSADENAFRGVQTHPNEPPTTPNEAGRVVIRYEEAKGGQGIEDEWRVEVDETCDGVESNRIPTPQTTQTNDADAVQVEPGGRTSADEENTHQAVQPHVEEIGSIVHECRRTVIVGKDGGMLRDEQDDGGMTETHGNASNEGEKKMSSRNERSTSGDEEHDQRDTRSEDDVPRTSPYHAPPSPNHRERSRVETNEDRDENELNARCNSKDARTKSCDRTAATRAQRVELGRREGGEDDEDVVTNATSRSGGRHGRERPKDERERSRAMTKEVEGQGEYWRGETGTKRDGERDGSDDGTCDDGRDSGRVESQKILADGRRDQRYTRKLVTYSPRPSPTPIPHHAKRPIEPTNPPRRRGRIKPNQRSRTMALAYANSRLWSRRDHCSATNSRRMIQSHQGHIPDMPSTRTKDAEAANSIPHHPAVPRAVH